MCACCREYLGVKQRSLRIENRVESYLILSLRQGLSVETLDHFLEELLVEGQRAIQTLINLSYFDFI